MSFVGPIDRQEWFEALARSTKARALGSEDEQVRATLLDVADTHLKLAAMHENYCFCGRQATCYRFSRGKRLGFCHLHKVAWEQFAEEHREMPGPSNAQEQLTGHTRRVSEPIDQQPAADCS